MTDNVIKLSRALRWDNLRPDEATRICHDRAKDTKNIVIVGHPQKRKKERNFIDADIYKTLQHGMVLNDPILEKNDYWEFMIQRTMRGSRDMGVVVMVKQSDALVIVKTCLWIDPRRM